MKYIKLVFWTAPLLFLWLTCAVVVILFSYVGHKLAGML